MADTDTAITFEGRSGIDDSSVSIFAAPSPAGPFSFVARFPTDPDSRFSGSAVIPVALWRRVCPGGGFETFVRADIEPGTSLITFDDAAVSGRSAERCLAEESAEQGLLGAIRACQSSASPLAQVVTESPGLASEIDGDVLVDDPAEADDLVCVESIFGSLTIDDRMVTEIALSALTEVTGDVTIVYERGMETTATAETVDLPLLQEIGGDLHLQVPEPSIGGEIVTVDFGMPSLISLGGDLRIDIEAFNSRARGLTALPSLAGSLTYQGASSDANAGGLLTALASIGGDLNVTLGSSIGGTTQSFFNSLTRVTGTVTVSGGLWVGGNNFSSLAVVGGAMRISDIGAFPDPPRSGATTFDALTSVDGVLDVDTLQHPLQNVGAAAVSVGGIRLNDNAWLTDLSVSLASYTIDPFGPITITDNRNLPQCEAVAWVEALTTHVGPVTISGNQPCVP